MPQVLLTEFDADSSGALDFDEFSALVTKLQSGQSTLAMLDLKTAPSSIRFIKFEHYKLLVSIEMKPIIFSVKSIILATFRSIWTKFGPILTQHSRIAASVMPDFTGEFFIKMDEF